MFNRNRGRRVYHKTKESYQQNQYNRGRFTKFNETTPREDCFEENVYEADNILLDNIDPMRPESFPRFTPINKVMYLGISSESAFRTAVSALALKPEFDARLNQKKVQIQLENQASLFKLTQADLTNTISPAIGQITEAVNEVKEMVQTVSSITSTSIGKAKDTNIWKPLSEGEEEDEPPRKKHKKRNYRKKIYESDISEEEDQSPKREKDNQRNAWLLK